MNVHRTTRYLGLALAAALLAAGAEAQKKPRKNLDVDFDMNHIAEPKERKDAQYYDFFDSSIFEQVQQLFDLPRHFHKKPAYNVNAKDEVRPATRRSFTCARTFSTSSEMPSEKYC